MRNDLMKRGAARTGSCDGCDGARLQEARMRNPDFRAARPRIEVSVGESVRIVREFQEMTQSEPARLTGIPQSIASAIENNRVNLGVERA